jgi:hypothetical protein
MLLLLGRVSDVILKTTIERASRNAKHGYRLGLSPNGIVGIFASICISIFYLCIIHISGHVYAHPSISLDQGALR